MPRHVEKRLAWAKERVDWPLEKWMKVVFSDEFRFTVEDNDEGEHVLRPVGKRYDPKYVHQKTKSGRLFNSGEFNGFPSFIREIHWIR
jgi:hypothetical protein